MDISSFLALGLHFFLDLLYHVGPLFLFTALVVGVVGLPVPDELLLIASGYLVAHQKLNLFTTIPAAILGSVCGITISYLIGRLVGYIVIKKYGKTINLTEESVETAKKWFKTLGKWVLLFGYYIPLFRHVVGFVAGMTKLDFKAFALFAYSGAILWSMTFFSLGYFFSSWFNDLFVK